MMEFINTYLTKEERNLICVALNKEKEVQEQLYVKAMSVPLPEWSKKFESNINTIEDILTRLYDPKYLLTETEVKDS